MLFNPIATHYVTEINNILNVRHSTPDIFLWLNKADGCSYMELAAVSLQRRWSADQATLLYLLYYSSGLLPLSVTLSLSFIRQQGHKSVYFLLAASSVLQGHSAVL